jgi:long-chain acyl-CoA synthetase
VIYVGDAAQLGAVLSQAKGLPALSAAIAPDGIVDGQKAGKVRVVPFSETQIEEDGRVFEKDLAPDLDTIEAGDVATIVYTSGTTGEPKGVMLTHKNLIANVRADMAVVALTDADLGLSFLPTSHVLDRVVVHYMSVIAGGTIAYAQSLETVLADVAGTHPTAMCGVPRMFEKIYNAITDRAEAGTPTARRLFFWAQGVGRDFVLMRKEKKRPGVLLRSKYLIADLLVFSKVRKLFGGRMRLFASGGAHLREDIDLFFRAVKIPIMHGYGLTEATCTVTLNTMRDFMPETLGRPLPGVEVKIAPDGEILVRGDIVMKGYFNRPAESREALREGWLHTGDIGKLTGDGYLVMTDRKKDILSTSGGKNISPQKIETLLLLSRFIEQAVIIADGRRFVSALVVPNFAEVSVFCSGRGLKVAGKRETCQMGEIETLFGEIIDEVNKGLEGYERIRKFALLPDEFTVDSGDLTSTLKVKRRVINEKYREIIEGLYR